jgi:hypothetical protein
MRDVHDVTLPGGFWIDGERRQDARLGSLTGKDEEFLLAEGVALLPARRTTELLHRCLERLGEHDRPTTELVGELTVGDREALLLHLRRVTFGDRVSCVVDCPREHCGERMDIELDLGELLLAPYEHARPRYDIRIEGDAEGPVSFRLPRGSDQEHVAPVAGSDIDGAVDALLRRCLDGDSEEPDTDPLPAGVARGLAEAMAERDPQAEIRLDLECVACGGWFGAILDAGEFLCREIAGRRTDLCREVHALAFHYGWSEEAILALPTTKRERYLELLAEQLDGGHR